MCTAAVIRGQNPKHFCLIAARCLVRQHTHTHIHTKKSKTIVWYAYCTATIITAREEKTETKSNKPWTKKKTDREKKKQRRKRHKTNQSNYTPPNNLLAVPRKPQPKSNKAQTKRNKTTQNSHCFCPQNTQDAECCSWPSYGPSRSSSPPTKGRRHQPQIQFYKPHDIRSMYYYCMIDSTYLVETNFNKKKNTAAAVGQGLSRQATHTQPKSWEKNR